MIPHPSPYIDKRTQIRCDAAGAEEVSSCSSCRKSNRVCSYSRQPQKRGPSKGYIKELADRVKALEGLSDVHRSPSQRSPGPSLHASLGALQGLTAALGGSGSAGTKRSYSMMSNPSPGAEHAGGKLMSESRQLELFLNNAVFDGDASLWFNDHTDRYRQQIDTYVLPSLLRGTTWLTVLASMSTFRHQFHCFLRTRMRSLLG